MSMTNTDLLAQAFRTMVPAPRPAVALIAAERERQIAKEGWSPKHDHDEHGMGELAVAAACYASSDGARVAILAHWPWGLDWWKPTPNDRVRELVKAGALIVAEIERLSESVCKQCRGTGEVYDTQGAPWRCPSCKGIKPESLTTDELAAVLTQGGARARQPDGRCYACGWPYARNDEHGCVPGDCSYRPSERDPTYPRWHARMQEMMMGTAPAEPRAAEGAGTGWKKNFDSLRRAVFDTCTMADREKVQERYTFELQREEPTAAAAVPVKWRDKPGDVFRSFKAICKLPEGDARKEAFLWFSHGYACMNPLPAAAAVPAGVVTDAMLDRAERAYNAEADEHDAVHCNDVFLRRALEAVVVKPTEAQDACGLTVIAATADFAEAWEKYKAALADLHAHLEARIAALKSEAADKPVASS